MHNFAVMWLQILTLILPENTGMNMKEAPSELYCLVSNQFPSFSLPKFNHPLFKKQTFLPFISAQIHLKITL